MITKELNTRLITNILNDPYYKTSIKLIITLLEKYKTSKCYYIPNANPHFAMEGVLVLINSNERYNYYNSEYNKKIFL